MSFRLKIKIWIENDDEELIIGTGRVRILEAVLESGSLNKAAHKLNQPFRAVWGKIKATEKRCGFKVIETTSTGSRLTKEGLELLQAYNKLRNGCEHFAEDLFRDLFPKPKSVHRIGAESAEKK